MNQSTFSQRTKIAAYASLCAGALHATIVAFSHLTGMPPLETIFFVFIGLLQIAWAISFLSKSTVKKATFGLYIHLSVSVMWLLTRVYFAPFHGGAPESAGLVDGIVMFAQLISIFVLFSLIKSKHPRSTIHLTTSILGALVVGVGIWGSSVGMEMMMPNRQGAHHDDGHSHAEEEMHDEVDKKVLQKPVNENNTEKVKLENRDESKKDDHEVVDDHHDDVPHGH